jgi:hypothetical protein
VFVRVISWIASVLAMVNLLRVQMRSTKSHEQTRSRLERNVSVATIASEDGYGQSSLDSLLCSRLEMKQRNRNNQLLLLIKVHEHWEHAAAKG